MIRKYDDYCYVGRFFKVIEGGQKQCAATGTPHTEEGVRGQGWEQKRSRRNMA